MKLIKEITAWPFVVIMACSGVICYLVPPEWIKAIPGVSLLTLWIIELVPSFPAYIEKSHFPEVAELYFPLMLLISPLHFVWIWRQEDQHTLWRNLISINRFRSAIQLLFTTAFLLFVAMASFMWGGTQLEVIPWNESKIALFLAGHIAAGGGFFSLLAITLSGYKELFKNKNHI